MRFARNSRDSATPNQRGPAWGPRTIRSWRVDYALAAKSPFEVLVNRASSPLMPISRRMAL